MGITIKCGKSIETIQSVLEEIERRMPSISWGAGQSPASWNPRINDTSYGEYVVLFINGSRLTYVKEYSYSFIDDFVSRHHANDTIIYAEDFLSQGEEEIELENETDISFLFN